MKSNAESYTIRRATIDDAPEIRDLIARSIRALGRSDYEPEQIEAALASAFGLDTTLIRDGTYFVAIDERGALVACGGWSGRRTLFGADAREGRDESLLDPRRDAAKIRAFFVDPDHARHGLGRRLLAHSEVDAARMGFAAFELMATLPGARLYERHGYVAGEPISHPLPGGLAITFVPMRKGADHGADNGCVQIR